DAQRVAIVIAHYVAAIEDVSIGAIAAAEAKLIGPEPASTRDGLLQTLHDLFAVARVDMTGPPFHVRGIGIAMTKQLTQGIIEPERVFFQVPIPDAIVRRLGKELEALLGLPQPQLGALPLGDLR